MVAYITKTPIGIFAPDIPNPSISEVVLDRARNTIFREGAYWSIKRPIVASDWTHTSRAIDSVAYRRPDGAVDTWVLTDKGGVFILRTDTILEVLEDGDDSIEESDGFIIQFGENIVLGQSGHLLRYVDVRKIRLDSLPSFVEISGSPSGAVCGGTIGQFLFVGVGNTVFWSDGERIVGTPADGDTPARPAWFTSNTTEDTSASIAGNFLLSEDGDIKAIVGERNAFVMTSSSITMFSFSGGTPIFTRQRIGEPVGVLTSHQGVATISNGVFCFISEYGLYTLTDNGEVRDVGAGQINIWLTGENNMNGRLKYENAGMVSALVNHSERQVIFYLGDSEVDNILFYSYGSGQYTTANMPELSHLVPFHTNILGSGGISLTPETSLNSSFIGDFSMNDPRISSIFLNKGGLVLSETLSLSRLNVFGWSTGNQLLDFNSSISETMSGNFVSKFVAIPAILGEPTAFSERRIGEMFRYGDRVESRRVRIIGMGGRFSISVRALEASAHDFDNVTEAKVQQNPQGWYPILIYGYYLAFNIFCEGDWSNLNELAFSVSAGGQTMAISEGAVAVP